MEKTKRLSYFFHQNLWFKNSLRFNKEFQDFEKVIFLSINIQFDF